MKLKQDVYEDFYENKNLLDFSDYQQNSIEWHSIFLILPIKKVLAK